MYTRSFPAIILNEIINSLFFINRDFCFITEYDRYSAKTMPFFIL